MSGTTRVSRYQRGKANLDFTEARDSEWQWHQPGHMQVCTSLQTTAPSPHHSVYTSRMPFLPPSKQRQSTEGTEIKRVDIYNQCQFNLVARTVLMSCRTVDYQLLTQLVKNVLKFLVFVHLFACFNANF